MKKIFLILLFVFSTFIVFSQTEKYSKVKIHTDAQGMQKLATLGLAVDEGIFLKKQFFITDVSATELAAIRSNGFHTEILVDDVIAEYLKKNRELEGKPLTGDPDLSRNYPVPDDFELGSMGGFCTLEECYANLDYMAVTYPDLMTEKVSLGLTIENRPVYMVKLTGAVNLKDPKPQILYTGMHHAREPIGMMHLLFYMYYLLENYDTDPEIKNLVDHTEMYFIPIVNPDGYKYNQTTYPSGGGMWRKNRHNNGGGTYGVDLNRNYGYMWGGEGSSGYPGDETYRGTAPFSEPETQIVKSFCENNEFGIALNYHSVAALLLYPWGYTGTLPPDHNLFHSQAQLMTADNNYTFGPAYSTIYVVSGNSDDWMYGDQAAKNKIFAYTPEVGGSGFWPSISEIIPLCQENMLQSLLAAKFAGNYGWVNDETPGIIAQANGYLKFSVSQLGLDSNTSFSVSIQPLSVAFSNIGDSVILGGIFPGQTVSDSISYVLDPAIQTGTELSYIIKLNDGSTIKSDTIRKIFGQPVLLFNDFCDNLNNWTPGGWGISTSSYHSAPASITDSPSGNYQDNINKSITLTSTVDLTTAVYGVLNFWAKWDIESGYDYTQVKISTNGGSTWTPLTGNYTHPGTSNQAPGQPVYDGQQTSWVMETIDLNPWLGHSIKLRFTIVSDGSVTGDGFYFDDIAVTTIGAPTGHLISGLVSYPNAGNTPLDEVELDLKNNQGNVVSTTVTNTSGNYSFSGIADGSYTIEASVAKPWGGVTAADVLLFKKHIAGITPLSGIFLAAGDVNGSGSVSASDVLLIRKRITTIINSFSVGDWLFDPDPVTVNGGNVTQSFNGLTFGDANGSYQLSGLKNTIPGIRQTGTLILEPNGTFNGQCPIPVRGVNLDNLGAFQFSITYDPKILTFHQITDVFPGLESILTGSPKPGVLTFIWAADENGINITEENLFNIQFTAHATMPCELAFSDFPTSIEFCDFDGNVFIPELKSGNIDKSILNTTSNPEGFSIFPNPGPGRFSITSKGPDTETINITVTDPTGKEVYSKKQMAVSPDQGQTLDLSSLPGGIYVLVLEGSKNSFFEKIIILK